MMSSELDTAPETEPRVNEITFAAGTGGVRVSSTWLVNWNARAFFRDESPLIALDMFVFNVDAGAERGHLSYHGPNAANEGWSVHWKMATPDGMHRSESWAWPDPMPESDGRCTRFACVIIPRAALEPYPPGPKSNSEPVLLEPPGEGHQINVDIFFEVGESFPDGTWPGKTSKGTRFVGRRLVAIHAADRPPKVIGRWVLVTHTAPQSELLNSGEITIPAGAEMLDAFEDAPARTDGVDGHR